MANGDATATVDQASLTPDVFVRVRIEYGWFVADIATKGYFQQRSGSQVRSGSRNPQRKIMPERTTHSHTSGTGSKYPFGYVELILCE